MDNMEVYDKLRSVPKEAQKTIIAGKIKGFTDINPMWRIKMLTETFGLCGFGWYTEITDRWIEKGPDGKEAAFVRLNLYIKVNDEWSKPIEGIGGSMFVNIFKNSPDTNDEAFKMAYTDAISVACKALGMGADIYYAKDRTKYTERAEQAEQAEQAKKTKEPIICPKCGKEIKDTKLRSGKVASAESIMHTYGMCGECYKEEFIRKENATNE